MTKHSTGRKTPPNFRLTSACLASSFAAVTVTRVWGGISSLKRGVWGQQKACACLCADGQTVRDAGLYSQEGRQRSGIKATTDSPPGSLSGDVPGPGVKSCSGWLHYAVCAIKAAAGMAGVRCAVCVFCVSCARLM